MKDRMTLGHIADVAESAALTMADGRATERIVEACDYTETANASPSSDIAISNERCKQAAVQRVRRALGDKCANVIHA